MTHEPRFPYSQAVKNIEKDLERRSRRTRNRFGIRSTISGSFPEIWLLGYSIRSLKGSQMMQRKGGELQKRSMLRPLEGTRNRIVAVEPGCILRSKE